MKLIKCYISSFGKLEDFSFEFNSELNTIKEDNGWGKSTLATFIKSIFYGFSGGAKRNLDDNERKKFKPWNSSQPFGGYVQFEWGGKEYKLERYFGAKESEDTVNLIDVLSGKRFSNTENLGKRIFEIDEEGFLSTTYYSQKDFDIKSNTSLTAKFNAVCEVENSSLFDKALLRVEQKAKTYKYSGERGLIADAKRELFAINEEIEGCIRSEDTAKIIKKEADLLKEEVSRLKEKTTALTERVAIAGKAEAVAVKKARREELILEKNNLLASKNEVESVLNGNEITDDKLNECYQRVEELSGLVSSAKMIEEEIEDTPNHPKEQKKSITKKSLICTSIIAFLSLIVGITTIGYNLVLVITGFVLFLASIICLTVLFTSSKNNAKVDVYAQFVAERKQKLENLCKDAEKLKNKLDGFLVQFNLPNGYDYRGAIDYLKSATIKRKELLLKLAEVDTLIKGISSDLQGQEGIEEVKNIAELRQDLHDLQSVYAEKSRELANKLATVKNFEEIAEKLCDLESKKYEVLERIERYKEEYSTLTNTLEYLKKADENLKIRYRAPLENSLNKYLKMIAGDNAKAKIDIDLNVTVEERGGEKQTEYYSKGYRNLFEICKRFALTDVLFTVEKPFIILDDPFYNLDDEKLSSALDLVKKLAKEYQIIYLICHESRRV